MQTVRLQWRKHSPTPPALLPSIHNIIIYNSTYIYICHIKVSVRSVAARRRDRRPEILRGYFRAAADCGISPRFGGRRRILYEMRSRKRPRKTIERYTSCAKVQNNSKIHKHSFHSPIHSRLFSHHILLY